MLTIKFIDGSVLYWRGYCFKSWEINNEENEIDLYSYEGKLIATYKLDYIKKIEVE